MAVLWKQFSFQQASALALKGRSLLQRQLRLPPLPEATLVPPRLPYRACNPKNPDRLCLTLTDFDHC